MKVTIFGVTCGVGHELIRKALEMGHEITIVSRDPQCLSNHDSRLKVVEGSLTDSDSICRALHGQDAVICASTQPSMLQNIMYAMKKGHVKRFIGVAADTDHHQSRFLPGFLSRFFYAHPMVQVCKKTPTNEIDWTIVQPPELTFEPPRGTYRLYFNGCPIGHKRVSIADLADFMVKQLSEHSCSRKVVSVAY